MDQAELEQVVRNLNDRVTGVEQILPTLATKLDLEPFATKEDLERFATKEDLERFATKEDLKRFATKEDLERFATKADLEPFATKEMLREEGERTRRHFDAVAERLEGQIRLIADGLMVLREQFEDFRVEVRQDMARLDLRLMRLEASR